MAKIRIDFLVLKTFERLFGVTALLDVVDRAIPEIEWQEREALKRLAEEQQWDSGDYFVESDVLEEKFRYWLPRLAAYSVIILLHSIVETQLLALAERMGRKQGSPFRVSDIRGRGIEQGALYLERVGALDVRKDPGWRHIHHLQELRNMIVHHGGKRGQSEEHQRAVQRLLQEYDGRLVLPEEPDAVRGEIWISMRLCRDFAQEIQGFFDRLFKAAGLPGKGVT
jgi:hypothetical protein